jgi:hypothetical protein
MSLPPKTRVDPRYPFGVRFDVLRPEQVAVPVGLER